MYTRTLKYLTVFLQGLPFGASDVNGRLTIRSVSPSDAGEYVCSAIGVPGNYRASAQLIVDPRSTCRNLSLFSLHFLGPAVSPFCGAAGLLTSCACIILHVYFGQPHGGPGDPWAVQPV